MVLVLMKGGNNSRRIQFSSAYNNNGTFLRVKFECHCHFVDALIDNDIDTYTGLNVTNGLVAKAVTRLCWAS